MNASTPALEINGLTHNYGERVAVDDLSLTVNSGEVFVLLGPNGSGKTTLFRVLSTLIPPQQGEVQILGMNLNEKLTAIRQSLGVVFQAPSLDKKLTVQENLHCQGVLVGLGGQTLRSRADEMLDRLGIADRRNDLVETLSGGLKRRVELAKGMLHRPRLLLLDEPSTGLDPGARADMWQYLLQIRDEENVTVVLTTHLLEEADRADRIAILHEGKLAALDTPAKLQASVGGDSITIRTSDAESLAKAIRKQFECDAKVIDESVRLEQAAGHEWIPRLVEAFPQEIETITLGKPTLEDVFIARTGHRFWNEKENARE